MNYQPSRDHRFEYLWEVMSFIEERQCNTCRFKSDREDYSMCFEIEADLLDEGPVEALDDRGDDGVVCTKYATEQEPVDEDQLTLF